MLTVKNVKTVDGQIADHAIPSKHPYTIDAQGQLTLLPALIEPRFYLHNDWIAQTKAAIEGGITTILGWSEEQSTITAKKDLIEQTLTREEIPIRYRLYLNANKDRFEEIKEVKENIAGIKVSQIKSTNESDLRRVFQVAAQENLPILIEDDRLNVEEMRKLIELAAEYNAELILAVRTQEEAKLIQEAKDSSLLIHTFVTPEGLKAEGMLWKAIASDTIDMISNDLHHSKDFKIKTFLPYLLEAFQEKKISLEKIAYLTHINTERIFRLHTESDFILVNLEKKCPVYTIFRGKAFRCFES